MTAEPEGSAAEAGRAAGGGGEAQIVCAQEVQLSNKNGACSTEVVFVFVFLQTLRITENITDQNP